MGKRGPAPKPTAVKRLQGNPGKRALNKHEPQPAVSERPPRTPAGLSPAAQKAWRTLAPHLHQAGLLTRVDEVALRLLVETWADYQEARELVADGGMVAQSDKGNRYMEPAVGIMMSSRKELLRLLREFGMTPSSRSQVQIEQGEAQASLADVLFAVVNGEKK